MTTKAMNDASGTITSGGNAQTALTDNDARTYLFILNVSDTTMYVNFGVTAVADSPSIPLLAGAALTFEGAYVPGDYVSVIGATTAKKFIIKHA